MSIGNRIRDLRWDRRLKQGELARRAGIAQNTLSRIELGETTPSVPTLEKIARGLSMNVSDLLEEPVAAGKTEASGTRPTQGGIGRDIDEITVAPPKSRLAAELAPEIDFSRVEDLIDLSRVDVESGAAADVLVVSRDALVKALENVQGGIWSIEDAERALEREGRERLEQTYTVAFKQAYTDAREQLRGGVGKWSTS
jgi:transcriptional regulator with XRE-family HTH domain